MVDQQGQLIGPDQLRDISKDIRGVINAAENSTEDGEKAHYFAKISADVIFTSNSSAINALHRVAAWNALSTIIAQSPTSDVVEIRDSLWRRDIWLHAFEIYLIHAPNARPKSTQQLLSALIASLSKGPDEDTAVIRKSVLHRLVQAILNLDDPYRSKASAQLLSGLLGKDVVSLEEVLTDVAMHKGPQVAHFSPQSVHYILWILFQWIGRSDFGSTIAQLISKLLEKYDDNENNGKPTSDPSEAPVWALPLEISMSHDLVNVDDLRAHALPVLFKRSFEGFVSFLHTAGLGALMDPEVGHNNSKNEQLLCVALQSGNELGLVQIEAVKEVHQTPSALVLPVQAVGRLLLRESRTLRLTGLSLLVYSNSALRPLPKTSFQILKTALPNFFADVDADFRSDLFSLFQKLLDRIRSATAAQARQTGLPLGGPSPIDNRSADTATSVIKYHEQFLQWTVRFLTWELRPTASYQRHICSLKCLIILSKSGLDPAIPSSFLSKSALSGTRWPFQLSILSKGLRDSLLTLLLDPFEDVRNVSSSVLDMYISDPHANTWSETIDSALERATDLMLASGRADQADGVAHMWALKHRIISMTGGDRTSIETGPSALDNLVKKLEEMLSVARANLTEAVKRYPMHGILTSLRYVINQDSNRTNPDVCSRLSALLHEVWAIVKPTLCSDAPEGYLPEELDVGSDSTKEILSYCWRALKEASLLLNALVQAPQVDNSTLRALCELCFTQLVELRHRGAFSTVAQSWITCCLRSSSFVSSTNSSMIEEWYSRIIRMLENNITINTRRSAGLPSLLCGILVVDSGGNTMNQAMCDLTRIARLAVDKCLAEEGTLSQVHAMNCIKDILKNSRLGERSERYVPSALQLAADALHSDVWAIRNCGLMLFRAVIDRLLGTNDSFFGDEATGRRRLSSEQYPELLEVILGLLNRSSPTTSSGSVARNEGVFPALQLLQYAEVPEHRLDEVRQSILALVANPSWHVRDTAARTYAFLVEVHIQEYQALLGRAKSGQNALHGSLLAAKHFITRIQAGQRESQSIRNTRLPQTLISQIWVATMTQYSIWVEDHTCCEVTRAAYLDVVRESLILSASAARDAESLSKLEASRIISIANFEARLGQCIGQPGSAASVQALARLFGVRLAIVSGLDDAEKAASIELLSDLANKDEDACTYLLKEIDRILFLAGQDNLAVVRDGCESILRGSWAWQLKVAAHDLLSRLSLHYETPMPTLTGALEESSADLYPLQKINQHYADGWLQTQAIKLESEAVWSESVGQDQFRAKVSAWVDDCTLAIEGTGIFTSEAAVNSLDRVDVVWRVLASEAKEQSRLADLCLVVYDILNDDDEDIRLQAARITARILRAQGNKGDADFEPITAGQKLLNFCVEKLHVDDRLTTRALKRAFGITASKTQSVAKRLAMYSKTDDALFVQEKQNLYVDDAREIKVWSQAVLRLSLGGLSHQPLLEVLTNWVIDGLDVFTAHAKNTHDGGLGWSTKSETFVLGLQVIYGAEVLLRQAQHDVRIAARPSALRKKLLEFAVACEAGDVNDLWQWELHRVLRDSIAFKVARVAQVMDGMHST